MLPAHASDPPDSSHVGLVIPQGSARLRTCHSCCRTGCKGRRSKRGGLVRAVKEGTERLVSDISEGLLLIGLVLRCDARGVWGYMG